MTTQPRPESVAVRAPDGSLRRLWVRGVALGLGVQGLSLVLGLAAGAVAARLLGPSGLGEFAYALAAAGAASVPAALGLPAAVTKFLAIYGGREEWGLARGLLRTSDRLAGLASVPLALGIVAVGTFGWHGRRLGVFVLAAPLIPLLAWINLRQRALQGLHHAVAAQLPLHVLKPLAFLLLGGVLWLLRLRLIYVSQGLMTVWLASVVFAFIAGTVLLRRMSPPSLGRARPRYARREWLYVALPLFAASSIGVIYSTTDTLLLGALRPAAEVGFYQAAYRTAAVMTAFLGVSNWVLAPWFAKLHETMDRRRLQHVVTRSTRAVTALTLLMFMVLLFWGDTLLRLVFGSAFERGYPALVVLAVARLVDVGVGPVVNLLNMTGGQRALALTIGAAALANIIGCALLIPRMGMMGAALSSATAVAGSNLVLSAVVRRRTGIGSTVLGG